MNNGNPVERAQCESAIMLNKRPTGEKRRVCNIFECYRLFKRTYCRYTGERLAGCSNERAQREPTSHFRGLLLQNITLITKIAFQVFAMANARRCLVSSSSLSLARLYRCNNRGRTERLTTSNCVLMPRLISNPYLFSMRDARDDDRRGSLESKTYRIEFIKKDQKSRTAYPSFRRAHP